MKKVFVAVFSAVIMTALLTARIFPQSVAETFFSEEDIGRVDFGLKMPDNSAKSAIVIDGDTGNVICSKNADEARGMASTTKIMTSLIIIESMNPDDEVEIPKDAVGVEGSSVYLIEGERLTIKELLLCLMLESGNDSATALAIVCAGSIDAFCDLMNERASELGLTKTHFSNPHGLSDDSHRTTARELAIITAQAMKYPLFREIVSTKKATVRYDGIENGRALINHNKLLASFEGAIGVKTGYTKKDGRCLVTAAERDGMTLIAVTLDDPQPTVTHRKLLEGSFSQLERVDVANAGELRFEVPIDGGEVDFVSVENSTGASFMLPKGGQATVELSLPDRLSAPIEKGQIVGQLLYRYGGESVYITNIEASEAIKIKRKSIMDFIFKR